MQPAGDPAPFSQLAGPAEEAERLVSAYTALVPAKPVPVAEAVDRSGWIEANLTALATVLEPVVERIAGKAGVLGTVAGGGLAIEAGAGSRVPAGPGLGLDRGEPHRAGDGAGARRGADRRQGRRARNRGGRRSGDRGRRGLRVPRGPGAGPVRVPGARP